VADAFFPHQNRNRRQRERQDSPQHAIAIDASYGEQAGKHEEKKYSTLALARLCAEQVQAPAAMSDFDRK